MGTRRTVILALPRSKILLRIDVDQIREVLADSSVEEQRPFQALAHDGHSPDLPRPSRSDRISLPSFDLRITDGSSADTGRVEGMNVHQPSGGLRPADGLQSLSNTSREEGVTVGNVRNEGLQPRSLA